MRRLSLFKNIGPGALVAAAFIGPGTVTACTLAGVEFGYALLWALGFATLATIILQEMSARLGVVTRKGLGENLREMVGGSAWRWPLFALVTVALYVGNAAYEAGNLSGAALGLDALVDGGEGSYRIWVAGLAILAAGLLGLGNYRWIERALIALVCVMAMAFIGAFVAIGPDWTNLLAGLTRPSLPEGSLLTVIALIGTTIVPYNLFLHASAVKAKTRGPDDLRAVRADTTLSVGLGGIITILIASTAAASLFGSGLRVESVGDMARQLEPLFGSASRILLGLGLLAAGLSSAVTAPLATAYAMTEILGLDSRPAAPVFRGIALSVIVIGAGLALTGIKPITVILSAQAANGLLLPIIAVVLLIAMNRRALLGDHANGPLANLLGAGIVLVTAGLGLRLVLKSLGVL